MPKTYGGCLAYKCSCPQYVEGRVIDGYETCEECTHTVNVHHASEEG